MPQDQHPADHLSLPVRDESAALAATGGDAELAAEFFAALLGGLDQEIARLKQHWRAQDLAALADAAHRFRGATAYCGVPALDQALQELERLARTSKTDALEAGLAHVEQELERLRASQEG